MTEKLTFKEAIFEAETAAKFGKDPVHKWHLEQLKKLQANYVPRIEMTPAQKGEFDWAKRTVTTSELATNWLPYQTTLDMVSAQVFKHEPGEATDEQIETIMRAWLHPETIIISETGKPFVEVTDD